MVSEERLIIRFITPAYLCSFILPWHSLDYPSVIQLLMSVDILFRGRPHTWVDRFTLLYSLVFMTVYPELQ